MKLSIAWIFDHIQANWKSVDIKALVALFNQTTAEIESVETLSIDLALFTLVEIKKIEQEGIVAFSAELKKEVVLPTRKDVSLGQVFLIKQDSAGFMWATTEDLHASKGGLLPEIYVESAKMFAGQWKETFETEDVILEVDNKSITHRPDMWGHRGFAREIAAMLDLTMVPLENFITKRPIIHGDNIVTLEHDALSLSIESVDDCKRIAAAIIPAIENRPSILSMAHRLARVDSRPISALVDMTNYVMLDIGQPIHAFDAEMVHSHKVMIRRAHSHEKITLLDGEEINLTPHDLVVSDSKKVLGLAGVMGGSASGVNIKTTALIIESGCFSATVVRRTATRLKKRTEASARFEKTLDPNQTINAVERYLKLLAEYNFEYPGGAEIISVGTIAEEKVLEVTHSFLESRIGSKFEVGFVIHVLEKLDFRVVTNLVGEEIMYSITVPTFRATKDITIAEDIVEEVARFFGFLRIEPELPTRQLRPFSFSRVLKIRNIKQLMAYVGLMHEVQNYAIYDEDFLKVLKVQPENLVSIQNPVAEHLKYLVSSLMPHLLKNIVVNVEEHEKIRFFEWGRTWHLEGQKVHEARVLAGILYDKKSPVDFYESKNFLLNIFSFFGLEVTWQRNDAPTEPWFAPHQTADLMVGAKRVGRAGKINQFILQRVAPGDAFIFELDGDFFLSHTPTTKKFVPSSKYPVVERDISMHIPVTLTAQHIAQRIKGVDPKIVHVILIDFFEKKELLDQRSVTFRFVIEDHEKTLTKEEADAIWDLVSAELKNEGAIIR